MMFAVSAALGVVAHRSHGGSSSVLDAAAERETHECMQLAAALSTAYMSTKPFVGSTTAEVKHYLASNGVLLTMCGQQTANCSVLEPAIDPTDPWANDKHWSGSWLNSVTGVRRFPGVIGVIADPTSLDLRCIYPTDAGTDGRDDAGCGPMSGDAKFGSGGAAHLGPALKAIAQEQIRARMATEFPGRTWQNITCPEFFRLSFDDPTADRLANEFVANGTFWHMSGSGTCAARKSEKARPSFSNLFSVWEGQVASINGAPVCSVRDTAVALGNPGHWFEYEGECSWAPGEWQDMVDWMVGVFSPHKAQLHWNEIVASKPTSRAEEAAIAQAVFYITTPQMDSKTIALLKFLAKRNAEMWSKHVLRFDVAKFVAGGPMFVCDDDASAATEMSEAEPMSHAEAEALLEAGAFAKYAGAPRRKPSASYLLKV